MHNCAPTGTPMIYKETTSASNDLVDAIYYRNTIGALQYLTFTYLDIQHTITKVWQSFSQLIEQHLQTVKRILPYLKGTKYYRSRFISLSPLYLHASSDADWAGYSLTCQCTTSFCAFFWSKLYFLELKKATYGCSVKF